MPEPETAAPSDDFRRLTDPHRRELLLHCYRMLGSVQDAEDTLQEALLRAWKGLPGFEGRTSIRRWLYRIATHAALDQLARRRSRALPPDRAPPGRPEAPLPAPEVREAWLEPLVDDVVPDPVPTTEARLETRESVALAFLQVLQQLPPRQRAVLLLREVVGYSAEETAALLELTVPAANSALQRARDTVDRRRGTAPAPDPREDEVVRRLVTVLEASDADGLARLLRDDVVFSMPPLPFWLAGSEAVVRFHRAVIFPRMPADRTRYVTAVVNGAPGFVAWLDGARVAVDAVTVRDGLVAELHAFLAG